MHMAMGTVIIFAKNDSAAASSDEPSSRDIQEAHEHGLEIPKAAYLYTLFSGILDCCKPRAGSVGFLMPQTSKTPGVKAAET